MPASLCDLSHPARRLCDMAFVGALTQVRECRGDGPGRWTAQTALRRAMWWWRWFLSSTMWVAMRGRWGTLLLAVFRLRRPRIVCRRPTLETAGVGRGRGVTRIFFRSKAQCFGTSGGNACGYRYSLGGIDAVTFSAIGLRVKTLDHQSRQRRQGASLPS
jgi:hypothetical protein